MNRDRLIEAANAAIEARWETCLTNRDEVVLIVDAILPQVTTVEELEALSVGSKMVDRPGDVLEKCHGHFAYMFSEDTGGYEWSAGALIDYLLRYDHGPLTVVWQP